MTAKTNGNKTGGGTGTIKTAEGQLMRRPITAIKKKPRHTFTDGIKSLIKAITKMM